MYSARPLRDKVALHGGEVDRGSPRQGKAASFGQRISAALDPSQGDPPRTLCWRWRSWWTKSVESTGRGCPGCVSNFARPQTMMPERRRSPGGVSDEIDQRLAGVRFVRSGPFGDAMERPPLWRLMLASNDRQLDAR